MTTVPTATTTLPGRAAFDGLFGLEDHLHRARAMTQALAYAVRGYVEDEGAGGNCPEVNALLHLGHHAVACADELMEAWQAAFDAAKAEKKEAA